MGELKLVENEEGAWELYDDSYDVTIHCETEDVVVKLFCNICG